MSKKVSVSLCRACAEIARRSSPNEPLDPDQLCIECRPLIQAVIAPQRVEEPIERVLELPDGQWMILGLEEGADLREVADRIRNYARQLEADADRIEAVAGAADRLVAAQELIDDFGGKS